MSDTERYLIIQTAFLGDVVLALPMATYIKKKAPEAIVDMVVRPDARAIAEACPDVEQVYIFDKRKKQRGLLGVLSMAKQLRKKSYEAVFTPQRFVRSSLLSHATRIHKRYGFDKNALRWLYTDRIPYLSRKHEIVRNLSLVRAHWSDRSDEVILPCFSVPKKQSDTIALAPGSVWQTKRWPVHKWIELIQHPEMQKHPVVLIGGPKDQKVAQEIMQQVEHSDIENRTGKDNLSQTFQRIADAKILISNDSAPQHFAMAVKTPVITIFGSTIPEFGFAPIGKYDQYVQTTMTLKCRPCGIHGKKKCPVNTLECMESISVEKVLDKVNYLRNKNKERNAKTQRICRERKNFIC